MLIPEEAFIRRKPLFYNYNTVFSYIVILHSHILCDSSITIYENTVL